MSERQAGAPVVRAAALAKRFRDADSDVPLHLGVLIGTAWPRT